MQSEIRFYWGEDHLLIALGRRVDYRLSALSLVEFVAVTGVVASLYLQSRHFSSLGPLLAFFTVALVSLAFAASRLFSKIFFHESIRLDKSGVSLIRRSLVRQNTVSYLWCSVKGLHYHKPFGKLPNPETDRRLRILSRNARKQMLEFQNAGQLYFDTHRGRIRFATGISTSETAEIAAMMKLYAGMEMPVVHGINTNAELANCN